MWERLELLFKADITIKQWANTVNYSHWDYNYYSVSHLVCIGKQHSIYKVFTAKVGKVAGEDKTVRSQLSKIHLIYVEMGRSEIQSTIFASRQSAMHAWRLPTRSLAVADALSHRIFR